MKAHRLIFGMDIGGTRTKYGLVDLTSRQIVVQQTLPTEKGGLSAFVRAAGKAACALNQQAGFRIGDVVAAGVGVPGYVDGDQVSLVWESLAFLEGVTLRSALQEELGFPVRMDNDGRAAAMGETYFGGHASAGGVGRPRRLLSLTLGTGLGVALVVDGHLLEKSSINHLAGHIPIRQGAAACFCGFSGCLELLVGGPALVRNFSQFSQEKEAGADARKIFELAASGHPAARQAIGLFLDDLVVGLNAYVYLYGPDVIVLGGGLANNLGDWLPMIRQGLFAHPFEGYQVKVSLSTLGELAGLYGTASLWE